MPSGVHQTYASAPPMVHTPHRRIILLRSVFDEAAKSGAGMVQASGFHPDASGEDQVIFLDWRDGEEE